MKESTIQGKIAKRLRENGWLVTKLIQTSMNGIPDLMAIRKGNVIFLEVKKRGEEASELQKYVMDNLSKAGCFTMVVNSVEDIDVFCYKYV
jgi:Holliday junction resolvase